MLRLGLNQDIIGIIEKYCIIIWNLLLPLIIIPDNINNGNSNNNSTIEIVLNIINKIVEILERIGSNLYELRVSCYVI